jgi:hypothetical protein
VEKFWLGVPPLRFWKDGNRVAVGDVVSCFGNRDCERMRTGNWNWGQSRLSPYFPLFLSPYFLSPYFQKIKFPTLSHRTR